MTLRHLAGQHQHEKHGGRHDQHRGHQRRHERRAVRTDPRGGLKMDALEHHGKHQRRPRQRREEWAEHLIDEVAHHDQQDVEEQLGKAVFGSIGHERSLSGRCRIVRSFADLTLKRRCRIGRRRARTSNALPSLRGGNRRPARSSLPVCSAGVSPPTASADDTAEDIQPAAALASASTGRPRIQERSLPVAIASFGICAAVVWARSIRPTTSSSTSRSRSSF